MRRTRRTFGDTGRFLKHHWLKEIGSAAVLFGGSWLIAWLVPSAKGTVAPALIALAVTVGFALLLSLAALVVFGIRAGLAIEVDALRPGPEYVQTEKERIRELRSWVGMLTSEARDVVALVKSVQKNGYYWDPYRKQPEMKRFVESAGLLATDPTTEPAYHACDALRRELERIDGIVGERWSLHFGESILGPNSETFSPPVDPGDELDQWGKIASQAVRELLEAAKQLKRA